MPMSRDDDKLPPIVLRVLARLEALTGRMPVSRTLALIVLVGATLTGTVMGVVSGFERSRTQHERHEAVERARALVQDRIDFRMAMIHQVATWQSAAHASGVDVRVGSWSTLGIVVVPDAQASSAQLARWVEIDLPHAQALWACLHGPTLGRPVGACVLSLPGPAPLRYLVARIAAPAQGWVLMPLDDADVASGHRGADPTLQLSWRPLHGSAQAGAVQAPAGAWSVPSEVQVADARWPLYIGGGATPTPWRVALARQAGLWVAAGAGAGFTLASLHAYLLLISTRRRAREMARDMAAALQRTQSRNQAVMDTAPDAIVITDGCGLVRWCNQATTSIFGLTAPELMDQPLAKVLPALAAQSSDAWFEAYGISNRVIGHETEGLRQEGTAFPVAISASRLQIEGDWVQTFIVRDTTDAKWAEQELTLRDRALASSADGVVIVSMQLPNQPFIYVNQAFEHITGYPAHEVLGLNHALLQREDTQQPGIDTVRQAMQAGQGCKVVLRHYRKDGGLFYNDLGLSPVRNTEGVLTHYVGVMVDITERIAAEQVLQLRTARLNAVFDLSPDGFVVLDRRGEVSIVNPAFERMTDLRAADLVGQTLLAFEAQLHARCKSSEVEEAGDGLRELLHLHTPCTRTLVRRTHHGGHDNEIVMYFRDITHELEVDRMKSEFLAMAAHELRTPMVSIFGFTELLLRRSFSDERRQDMLSTIHRQAGILVNLVNELLDLARIESRRGKDFKRERQGLQALIRQVTGSLLMHNDPRTVDVSLPEDAIWLDVDREKFSLALTNVLSNAYKYSPQGGRIELDLVWREREGHSECGVRVTDHGLGMRADQVARVFERFFRADHSGNIPGTGLGMTIVKEIVELHGGQVGMVSQEGVGTTVTLWLPVQAPGARPPDSEGPHTETEVSTG